MKNERLRQQIFRTALNIVEHEGMGELSARKIATNCDCALGSIYTVYGNLQDLQLHINATILARLYDALYQTAEIGISTNLPLKTLYRNLGLAYFEFGKSNITLWKALFEYLPQDPIPDWYKAKARDGIYHLAMRLASAYQLDEQEVKKQIGFFWSAMHGMSSILLNRKMEMVAELFQEDYVPQYLEYCLQGLLLP